MKGCIILELPCAADRTEAEQNRSAKQEGKGIKETCAADRVLTDERRKESMQASKQAKRSNSAQQLICNGKIGRGEENTR